jgi:hypothetical protein
VATTLALAITANNVFKFSLIASLGGSALARRCLPTLLAASGGMLAGLLVLGWRASAGTLSLTRQPHNAPLVSLAAFHLAWRSLAVKTITQCRHFAAEAGAVAAIRVDDDDFGTGRGMAVDEMGQLAGLLPLVQNIAADDQVKTSQPRIVAIPVARQVFQR